MINFTKALLLMILFIFIATGCSTVTNVKKYQNYHKPLVSTKIIWANNKKIHTKLSYTKKYYERSKHLAQYRYLFEKKLKKSLLLYRDQTKKLMSTALSKYNVEVRDDTNETYLIFTPILFTGSCNTEACSGDLSIKVSIFDAQIKKTVWQANFEPDGFMLRFSKDTIIDRLIASIIEQLILAEFLPKSPTVK